jgi:hypothetical protein
MPEVLEHAVLYPRPGWPVWLKDHARASRADGTSGIAYAGRDSNGRRCFFLVDDVGAIHFCRVSQDADTGKVVLGLESVAFGQSLIHELEINEHWDFEAIAIDPVALPAAHPASVQPAMQVGAGAAFPDTIPGVLSVEGRGKEFLPRTRILDVRFIQSPVGGGAASPRWRVESHGDAMPQAHFWQGDIAANRGIEGLAIGARYLFLGLESLDRKGELNLHGTVLYLYDRGDEQAAIMATRSLGIFSICGLQAITDTVTVIADRNRQAICVLRWNPDLPGRLRSCDRFPLDLPAPGGFRYAIPSIEGLTVDAEGDLWCTTDPWHGRYRVVGSAPETTHVYIAAEIPMLYRFPGEPVWEAAGLAHLWPTGRTANE